MIAPRTPARPDAAPARAVPTRARAAWLAAAIGRGGARARRAARLLAMAAALALAGTLAPGAPPACAQTLYWLDTNFGSPTLNSSDFNGAGVTSIALAAGSLPEGLAADASGRVFYTEAAWANASVRRVAGSLAGNVALVSGGSSLRGIAVNAAAGQLYWTSSNLLTGAAIHRSDLLGGGATTVLTLAPGANPRGIAVNAPTGKMYWTDFDSDVIWRANLDGSSAAIWLTRSAGARPYGIAVDPAGVNVYWTEYGTGTLWRATAAATGLDLLAFSLSNPTYLAMDPGLNYLFWTEGGIATPRIRRSSLTGTGQITLPPTLMSYGGIAVGLGSSVSAPGVELPTEFAIERAWPVPARGALTLSFALPREAAVRLSVLDVQGREVAVLADGVMAAGRHERVWETRGAREGASPGVYFARFVADGRAWVRRVVVTR